MNFWLSGLVVLPLTRGCRKSTSDFIDGFSSEALFRVTMRLRVPLFDVIWLTDLESGMYFCSVTGVKSPRSWFSSFIVSGPKHKSEYLFDSALNLCGCSRKPRPDTGIMPAFSAWRPSGISRESSWTVIQPFRTPIFDSRVTALVGASKGISPLKEFDGPARIDFERRPAGSKFDGLLSMEIAVVYYQRFRNTP